MALNAAATWLVAYDIADKRRLARVHRHLKRHATPVQYSVFVYRGSVATAGRLAQDLERLIDIRADDVRIYRLPERIEVVTFGRTFLPEGMLLTGSDLPRILDAPKIGGGNRPAGT